MFKTTHKTIYCVIFLYCTKTLSVCVYYARLFNPIHSRSASLRRSATFEVGCKVIKIAPFYAENVRIGSKGLLR